MEKEVKNETAETAKEVKSVNPMFEFVEVRIPPDPILKKEPIQVGINGKTYFVPRGVKCSIPKPVAEVIANSFAQQEAAYDIMDALAQE